MKITAVENERQNAKDVKQHVDTECPLTTTHAPLTG